MYFSLRIRYVCVFNLALIIGGIANAQAKRAITASDCASVRYVYNRLGETSISINPQGNLVAYLVKVPNIPKNENEISLYIRSFPSKPNEKSRLIASDVALSQIHWLQDGRHVLLLITHASHVVVASIDVQTGAKTILATSPSNIEEFSTDAEGNTIVFSTKAEDQVKRKRTRDEIARGYRVLNQGNPAAAEVSQSIFAPKHIFWTRRIHGGDWGRPRMISIQHPLTRKIDTAILCAGRFNLSLSPDGRKFLMTFPALDFRGDLDTSSWPSAWVKSSTVQARLAKVSPVMVTVLRDLESGATSMPIPTPYAISSAPLWSSDSASFVIAAMSPVDTSWEAADKDRVAKSIYPFHVWQVYPADGRIQQVLPNVESPARSLLAYRADKVVLRTASNMVTVFARSKGGVWEKMSELHIPLEDLQNYGGLASDGEYVLTSYQTPQTPPEIISFRAGDTKVQVVARLNEEFDQLTFAPMRPFSWDTSAGIRMEGLLVLPIHYVQGQRYPLVIQTKTSRGEFLCDGGENHPPSFAPQPLANADIAYLVPQGGESANSYPQGYPGGIGEAAFYADAWGSAVSRLDRDGIIDKNKVGIIGFSRTGWHVEFALTHSAVRYAAATAADNVQFSLGEYWIDHADIYTRLADAMYAGPPYGSTLENWMKYSISFNLEKIHTPLLMEEMGYGIQEDKVGSTPFNLAGRYEIVTGLTRLRKPIEMYYYPEEDHEPDHPQARLANVQRNVDWYRFWLQGYERPNPEDPDQYKRWEHLRELRDADLKTAEQLPADTSKSQ
jgi:dipeptidyl aminopeptidase/acylaminoacyl peptidase